MGLGQYQKSAESTVQIEIILALLDGKWHRHKQLGKELSKRVSRATMQKHLKILTTASIVERKMELSSYPSPVFYRLTSRLNILARFAKRYGHALGELTKTLEQVKSQDESLALITEYFGKELNIMSELAGQMRPKDVDMMILLFLHMLQIRIMKPLFAQITKKREAIVFCAAE
jgi:DNA-binding HxlR family transcriptional regulator